MRSRIHFASHHSTGVTEAVHEHFVVQVVAEDETRRAGAAELLALLDLLADLDADRRHVREERLEPEPVIDDDGIAVDRAMMRLVPRQARAKVRVLFVLLLLLLVAGSVSYLGWRESVAGPSIVTRPPRLVAHKATFPVTVEARRGNVVGVEIALVQAGRSTIVAKADGPLGARGEVPSRFRSSFCSTHLPRR
jgi:hypothetical protein